MRRLVSGGRGSEGRIETIEGVGWKVRETEAGEGELGQDVQFVRHSYTQHALCADTQIEDIDKSFTRATIEKGMKNFQGKCEWTYSS